MEERLIDVKEAAKKLGVGIGTVRFWVFHRKIDCVRLGGRVRFRPSTIEKLQKDGFKLDGPYKPNR